MNEVDLDGILAYPMNEDLDANRVLISALDKLKRVALVGIDKETGEYYMASSEEDGTIVLADIKKFKKTVKGYVNG